MLLVQASDSLTDVLRVDNVLTGQLPHGLPYAISSQYQRKPLITTVSPVCLHQGNCSMVK